MSNNNFLVARPSFPSELRSVMSLNLLRTLHQLDIIPVYLFRVAASHNLCPEWQLVCLNQIGYHIHLRFSKLTDYHIPCHFVHISCVLPASNRLFDFAHDHNVHVSQFRVVDIFAA